MCDGAAPGGEVTIRYELRARPGRHAFQPTTVLCRDASGSVEVELSLTAASSFECEAEIPTVPLRAQTGHHPGPLVTDDGGEGIEFHSVESTGAGTPRTGSTGDDTRGRANSPR